MYSCKIPSWLAVIAFGSGNRLYCLFFSRQWALSLVIVRCQVAPVRQAGRNCSCPITAAPSQKALSTAPGLLCLSPLLPGVSVYLLSSHLCSQFAYSGTSCHLEIELDFFLSSFYISKISENSFFFFPKGASRKSLGVVPNQSGTTSPQPFTMWHLEMFGGIFWRGLSPCVGGTIVSI